MQLIKSTVGRSELIEYNSLALGEFLKQFTDVGAKVILSLGINSENKVNIVFVQGVTLDQVRELIQQVSKELEKMKE